jgi:hypothetical protein
MTHLSNDDDARYFKLRYESEGAGAFLRLYQNADEKNYIAFDSPAEILKLYEEAKRMWAQGDIYCPNDALNQQQLGSFRVAILEEAAAECERLMPESEHLEAVKATHECAQAIRALAGGSTNDDN